MAAIASSFCGIVATHVLALITSSKRCGQDSMHAHVQLSCVYLVSVLDITRDKMYQTLSFLSGENLGRRLRYSHLLSKFVVETSFSLIF